MSTYKVRNYNFSYEMMLAAAKEYEKHIAGGGLNNQLYAYSGIDEEVEGLRLSQMTSTEDAAEQTIFKEIATRVLDRTTGVYFTEDLVTGKAVKWDFPSNFSDYVEVYHGPSAASLPSVGNLYLDRDYSPNHTFYKDDADWYADESKEVGNVPSTIEGVTLFDTVELSHILKGLHPVELQETAAPLTQAELEALGENPTRKAKKEAVEKKNQKIFVLDRDLDPKKPFKMVQYPINTNPSEPDKILNPSLSTYVMKHHKLGMPGKKANHLSVFFGAVSALEMSRCTPFLNLIIMHEASQNGPTKRKLNQTAFMRFVRNNENGDMVLDSTIYRANGPSPRFGGQTRPEYAEYEDLKVSTEYSLMDIFTSPQTMANANINSAGSYDWVSKNVAEGKGKGYNTSPVLDPIQPFLTLNELSVTISGAGFGIMASKVANLTLTLHDRSRLKELAPLIASDKFSSTKIRVEFGWTHPDAGPTSDNTIGNYIDGLRDIGLYTVHGSDYSFSGDNTVGIQLKLSCAGYAESKSCPAAGGPVAPMYMFRDFIDKALQNYIAKREKEAQSEAEKKKLPEIRQILKARARTAKSPSALIEFEEMQKLMANLKDTDQGKDKLVQAIAKVLKLTELPEVKDGDVRAAIAADNFVTTNTLNAQEWLFSKLYACRPGITPDPFAHSFITQCADTALIAADQGGIQGYPTGDTVPEINAFPDDVKEQFDSNGTIKTVSLGKLCTLFIGASLATNGLFDEVQLMFYPLNHQAGGARKHTTASFPIEYPAFEKKMKEVIAARSRLTVQAFFGIIDKMVRDVYSRSVYGFLGMKSKEALDKFNEIESEEDRIKEAVAHYKNVGSELHKDEKKALAAYKAYLKENVNKDRLGRLPDIYAKDGVEGILSEATKFVKPNLTMFYEVVPVVHPPNTEDQGKPFEFGFKFDKIRDEVDSDGLKSEKSVLRVHIFDEEAVSDPTSMVLGSVMYEGKTGEIVGQIQQNSQMSSATIAGTVAKTLAIAKGKTIQKVISQMSFGDVKQFLKRAYPSITYGASTGTINNISVSGNTSGQLSNVLMVENYFDNAQAGTSDADAPADFEETILFPSSISVNMMGMPLLFLGENMFIDFNTDTSLDNIYTVKSVNHSIGEGKFTTNVELVASNQGAVKAFRDQMTSRLTQIMDLPE